MSRKGSYSSNKNSYRSHEARKTSRDSYDFYRNSRKTSDNSSFFLSGHTSEFSNNSGPALTMNSQKEYNSYWPCSSQEDNDGIKHTDDFRHYQSDGNDGKHTGSHSMHSLHSPVSQVIYKESGNDYQSKTYHHDDYQNKTYHHDNKQSSYKSEEFRSSTCHSDFRQSEYKMRNSLNYSRNEQKKNFINKNLINDESFRITIKNDQLEKHPEFYDVPNKINDLFRTSNVSMNESIRYSSDTDTNLYRRKNSFNSYHGDEIRAKLSHNDQNDLNIDPETHHYENDFNGRNSFEHAPGYRSSNKDMFYEDYQSISSNTYYHDNFFKSHDRKSENFQQDASFNPTREEIQLLNRGDVDRYTANNSNFSEQSPNKKKDNASLPDVHSSVDDVKRTLNIRDIKKILDIVEQFPCDNINKLSNIILEKGRKMIDDEKNAMQYSKNTQYLQEDNFLNYGDDQNLASRARNRRNSYTSEGVGNNYYKESYFDDIKYPRRKSFIDQTEELTTEINTQNHLDRRYRDKERVSRDRERLNSFQSGRLSKNSKTVEYEALNTTINRRGRSQSPYIDRLSEWNDAKKSHSKDSSYSKDYKYKERIGSHTTSKKKPSEKAEERGHLRNTFQNKDNDQEHSLKSKKTYKVDQDSNENFDCRSSNRKYENKSHDRKTSIEAMLIEAGNKAVSKKGSFPPIYMHAPIAPSIGVPIQQVFPVDQSFHYPRFSIIPNYLPVGNLKPGNIIPGNIIGSGVRINGIFNNSNSHVVPLTSTSNYLSASVFKNQVTKSSNLKRIMVETSKKNITDKNDQIKDSSIVHNQKDLKADSINEDHSTSKKKSKKSFPKWFDKDCRQLYMKRRKLKLMIKRAKHFPNDKNKNRLPYLEEQMHQVKKILSDKIRCLKSSYMDSAINKDDKLA